MTADREPRTAAGRALLHDVYPEDVEPFRKAILAIEAEAAALDVERLARAIHIVTLGEDDCYLDHDATPIAAEYARLAEPKP